MNYKADDLAARHEAFRRAAPNRASTTFGPEFHEAFAVWDRQQRRRKLMLSLLVVVAAIAIGGLVFLQLFPITPREACDSLDGTQVAGLCETVD